jgi:hypothetical protein
LVFFFQSCFLPSAHLTLLSSFSLPSSHLTLLSSFSFLVQSGNFFSQSFLSQSFLSLDFTFFFQSCDFLFQSWDFKFQSFLSQSFFSQFFSTGQAAIAPEKPITTARANNSIAILLIYYTPM